VVPSVDFGLQRLEPRRDARSFRSVRNGIQYDKYRLGVANNGAQTCLRATSAGGFVIGMAALNGLIACRNCLFDERRTLNIRQESNGDKEAFEDHSGNFHREWGGFEY
jgi:hypothetical protein